MPGNKKNSLKPLFLTMHNGLTENIRALRTPWEFPLYASGGWNLYISKTGLQQGA